ncbi:hypothetical protein Esi_0023_0022 [Ectocarpus siliculosus]|uniref:Uncharacterized protein n=1 Tax=Ectocarpus siliculosus TaxID=2880 RepID=D8LIT6_ECTSI|nr:hypothetical protein Esi_0023_0022 [Ectocarpus siliculosus]|eukprot:CBN76820.1 hypothetical protein Esi_0023_0022 [Ectocarpus siliculosus]
MLIPSAFSAKELEQGFWKSSTIITQSRGLPSMARWRIHQGRTTLSSTTARSSMRTLIVPQLFGITCFESAMDGLDIKNMKLRTAGEECLRLRVGLRSRRPNGRGKKWTRGVYRHLEL